MSFFDGTLPLKVTKPIRLIELFAGIGAQAKALKNLGADFERYRICEIGSNRQHIIGWRESTREACDGAV